MDKGFDVRLVDGVKKDDDGMVCLNSKVVGWDVIKAFYAANPYLLTPTELRRKGLSCSGVMPRSAWWSNPGRGWCMRYDERECHPPIERELEAERDHRRELRARAKRRGPQSRCDGGLRTTCTPHTSGSRRAACREPTPHRSSSRPGRASTTGCPTAAPTTDTPGGSRERTKDEVDAVYGHNACLGW